MKLLLAALLVSALILLPLSAAKDYNLSDMQEFNKVSKEAIKNAGALAHYQPLPEPASSELISLKMGVPIYRPPSQPSEIPANTPYWFGSTIGANFYATFDVSTGGKNLMDNDTVCKGSEIKPEEMGLNGEWFTKGGAGDSPPIVFVDSIEDVKRKIEDKEYKTKTYPAFICTFSVVLSQGEGWNRCLAEASMICQPNCRVGYYGTKKLEKPGATFATEADKEAGFGILCKPECILFVDRESGSYKHGVLSFTLEKAYGYMTFLNTTFSVNALKQLTTASNTSPSAITILGKSYSYDTRKRTGILRYAIKNTGISTFLIKEVQLEDAKTGKAIPYPSKILYMPKALEPGQESEILFSIERTPPILSGRGVEFTISIIYRNEQLGCSKERKSAFKEGTTSEGPKAGCSSDVQCESGVCCAGLCRNQDEGICEDIDGDGIADTWVPN